VSDHDKRYMQKLAEFSAELERDELPPMTPADRKWFCEWVNRDRAQHGLPLFSEEDIERSQQRDRATRERRSRGERQDQRRGCAPLHASTV
jgi:hypothetical protein